MWLERGARVVLATHNAGKRAEFAALMADWGIDLVSAGALGLAEPAETEVTFLGNARIKARAAARASGLPALADDSGLCVAALGGAPGVATADWAEVPGGGRNFRMAMERVQAALVLAGAAEPWVAAFHVTLVLAAPDGAEVSAEGRVAGRLVWPTRGQDGHGFDPMFLPDGFERTFAEMTEAEKNAISHRAVALRALRALCFT
jgi:XTP/dITP diphosphohydrolase